MNRLRDFLWSGNEMDKMQGMQEHISAETGITDGTHDLLSAAKLPLNPQTDCLFFHKHHGLPLEIRTMIFEYVLASYEDYSRPRRCPPLESPHLCSDERYYQEALNSGHRGLYYHRSVDTALLRTCQLIYRETYLTPITENTHALYYSPIAVWSKVAATYFQCMTLQRSSFLNTVVTRLQTLNGFGARLVLPICVSSVE